MGISMNEAAARVRERIGLGYSSTYRAVVLGEIKSVRIAGHIVVDEQSVEEFTRRWSERQRPRRGKAAKRA